MVEIEPQRVTKQQLEAPNGVRKRPTMVEACHVGDSGLGEPGTVICD